MSDENCNEDVINKINELNEKLGIKEDIINKMDENIKNLNNKIEYIIEKIN